MAVRFQGRLIDPVALWQQYVDFPPGMDTRAQFSPTVFCPNPEHENTRTPAFQINLQRPFVHCFGECGISGTYESAIAMITGTTRRQARREILKHSRIAVVDGSSELHHSSPKKKPTPQVLLDRYSYLPPVAVDYLEARGLVAESVAKWELGWNPESKRITLPARDERGRVAFIIERAIKANVQPRYLYPEGSGEAKKALLYGACLLDKKRIRSDGIVIVEGSFDAIKLHQHTLTNTVSILGARLHAQQARQIMALRPKRVFLMLDRDGTGVWGIQRAWMLLRSEAVFVCRYRGQVSDPDQMTKEDAEISLAHALPYPKWNREVNRILGRS